MVAVIWIQIFVDYRRKLGKIMPTVSQVSTRRNEISKEDRQRGIYAVIDSE
ncbi:uncharacterized protein METZ01_LOCUS297833 [marine metagenome]|uniref:Uncharacterized protein n=1 Tax=marine metagenome TaxID=408172 RepID=A0A382M7X3_9ZZZZ